MTREKIIEVMARAICREKTNATASGAVRKEIPQDYINFVWRLFADDAEAALDALSAEGMTVVPGWQPIESAPKDGTRFIAWVQWADGGNWHECWWEPTGWWVEVATRDCRRPAVPIKGWQPLPAPPAAKQQEESE